MSFLYYDTGPVNVYNPLRIFIKSSIHQVYDVTGK